MQLIGLMLTKDDQAIFAEWCRDQLPLYDAVVCLDGSVSPATESLSKQFGSPLVYLHERDFPSVRKTDHGLRRVVHREIVRRFGMENWIMCCHPDEFCYHDPRKVASRAEQEGCDGVAWFSLHFLPHPDDLPNWHDGQNRSWTDRVRHYHWNYLGTGSPWVEFRLYRNGPAVTWDRETHGSTQPHGLERIARFRPCLKHYKVITTDLDCYDSTNGNVAYYKMHWDSLENRTGLAFTVQCVEDLFVRAYPEYACCSRLEGSIPHWWNMGESFRPDPNKA